MRTLHNNNHNNKTKRGYSFYIRHFIIVHTDQKEINIFTRIKSNMATFQKSGKIKK